MSKVRVEAFEDPSRPEGGHVVVLLHGLKSVPSRPAVRLRPVEPDGGEDAAQPWTDIEQLPVSTRVGPDGLELVLGPDVVEDPQMTPGQLLAIELPDAGVSGEFSWPVVSPRPRPKRNRLLTRSPPREPRAAAEPAANGQGSSPERAATGAPAAGRVAGADRGGEAPRGAVAAGPAGAKDRVRESATMDWSDRQPSSRQKAGAAPVAGTAIADGDERMGPAAGPPDEADDDRGQAGFETFYPHARGSRVAAGTTRRGGQRKGAGALLPSSPLGMLAAIALGVGLVQGAIFVAQSNMPASPPATSAIAGTSLADAVPAAEPTGVLFDALAAGEVSPRGVNAREATGLKALELAQAALQGRNGSRDADEGAFWLRRYVTGAAGEERTLRALTHLGSAYANPTERAPDYARARVTWELASALGDAVAMCFVGVLHENGHGVARDKTVALQWYERAKRAGGCPDVDDAIARTRK